MGVEGGTGRHGRLRVGSPPDCQLVVNEVLHHRSLRIPSRNAPSAASRHRRGTIRNVQAIAWPRVRVKCCIDLFLHWQRFASHEGLVGFEIDGFNDAVHLLVEK